MRKLLPCLAMLGLFSLPLVSKADTFNFTIAGSAGGLNGSGTLTATQMGSYYLVTGISGTGITGLLPVGTVSNGLSGAGAATNDNELFPGSNPFVDGSGIGFRDLMGNTAFNVDLFSTGAGAYFVNFVDSDGFSPPFPLAVTLSVTPGTVTPEPSSLMLLGTGVLGLAGVARRRFLS